MGAEVNIIEAARAMERCKKVRRSGWRKGAHIYQGNWYFQSEFYVMTQDGVPERFEVTDFLADDWEVVNEQNV